MNGTREGETLHATSHPLRGRVQVALPEHGFAAGRALSISVHELCAVLDDQIPIGTSLMIRFELFAHGRMHVVVALAKSAYGVFASRGAFASASNLPKTTRRERR